MSVLSAIAQAGTSIVVMTQNMDEGTDYQALLAAQNVPAFLSAVTQTFNGIAATDPAARALGIAREIAARAPALVGLQEASIVRTGPAPPATNVSSDLLQSVLTDLGGLGAHYQAVAVAARLDAEAPSTLGFDVRLTTQDAILARTDLPASRYESLDAYVRRAASRSHPGRSDFAQPRLVISGRNARGPNLPFIDTHLDTGVAPPVQLAQAAELTASANRSGLPAVYVGDFNTSANDPADPTFGTYETLLNAGLTDAWTAANPGNPGPTCCQAPDLMNPTSLLSTRGDLIFTTAGFGTLGASLVGNDVSDLTPTGLWPSDHAGVIASLGIDVPEPGSVFLLVAGFLGWIAAACWANPPRGHDRSGRVMLPTRTREGLTIGLQRAKLRQLAEFLRTSGSG